MSQEDSPLKSDEKSEESLLDAYALGRRVQIEEDRGTIRYVGPVATSKKQASIWVGIEWDKEGRGKHDGSVTSKTENDKFYRYFSCLPQQGSFIKPVKISNDKYGFGHDLVTVILNNYSLDDLDSDLAQQESISKDSNYKIEFVGWKKSMQRMCDLPKRRHIIIDRSDVAYIISPDNNLWKQKNNADVAEKMKNLRETIPVAIGIDLRWNLISSVNNLYGIHCLADTLVDLNLSHNKLNMFYCFDSKQGGNGKNFEAFNAIFKDGRAFGNLKRLVLNDTASLDYGSTNDTNDANESKTSDDATQDSKYKFHFNTWEFVYYLIVNGCVPNLVEIEFCSNHLSTFELFLPQSGDLSNDKDVWAMRLPDCQVLLQNIPNLQLLNFGDNPLSQWSQVSYLFGKMPKLTKLQANWCKYETIKYNTTSSSKEVSESKENETGSETNGEFANLKTLFVRNNEFNDISVFDELNKFPMLGNVLFLQSKFASVYGDLRLRDFAIAKIKNMFVCNSSSVQDKERHDAELFYLKYITSQVSQMNLMGGSESSSSDASSEAKSSSESKNEDSNDASKDASDALNSEIANKIESLFPRYKELVSKYGVIKQKKVESSSISTASVTLRSMDPKSITLGAVEKQLPINMTVAQLKMLMKRYYKLHPKHQRLMMRERGSEQMPMDLGGDTKTLAFCGVKDGMEILMQSNDFAKET